MTHPTTNAPSNAADPTPSGAPPRRPAALDAHVVQHWLAAADAPRLLDVRSPSEFTTAHIPGSYNVPLDLLREHKDELRTHLGDDVVLVCRSGARATQAETVLSTTGPENLYVLVGGMTAWEAAGGPVNRGAPTWELERQVRLVAGSIVLAGVLASTVAPWAKWVSAGIGAGLAGAALTNSCAMGMLLSRLPYNRRTSLDLAAVLSELRDDR